MNASGPSRFGAVLLAAIFGVALVLLFVVIYLVTPVEFNALLEMGVLALILGLVAYFAQALSRDPSIQRALGWGLGAMGFFLLFADVWLGPAPPNPWTVTTKVEVTLLLVALLAIAAVLGFWRMRGLASTERRMEQRASWDHRPPVSAFDYATGKAPGAAGGLPATPAPPRGPEP
jgi:hypothetical protein